MMPRLSLTFLSSFEKFARWQLLTHKVPFHLNMQHILDKINEDLKWKASFLWVNARVALYKPTSGNIKFSQIVCC